MGFKGLTLEFGIDFLGFFRRVGRGGVCIYIEEFGKGE